MRDLQESIKIIKKQSNVAVSFLKRNELTVQLLLIPLILLTVYFILHRINDQLQDQINRLTFHPYEASVQMNPYPQILLSTPVTLTAEAAIIVDANSQTPIFQKNPNLRFSMASTTKVMTALVGLDYFKPDDVLTVYSQDFEGSRVGFSKGDKLFFDDLLYGMFLPSGNDAALTIAQNYPGGVSAFVQKMNEKAKDLHLTNTNYADPAGLDDDEDYATVVDMARLGSVAMRNKTIARIAGTKHRVIATVDGSREFDLVTLNKLLGSNGVIGLKTGHTEGAGDVLITSKIKDNNQFIIVVMKSENRFLDTEVLLHMLDTNLSFFYPHKGPVRLP